MPNVNAVLHALLWAAAALWAAAQSARAFDCIETKCPQMSTCAQAHYKLTVCGHKKRDADGDGIPCEDLCGSDMATYQARVKAQMPDAAAPDDSADADNPVALIGARAAGDDAAHDEADRVLGGAPAESFTCAGKKTCKQMVSCAEATFYLAQCGVKSLDGDRDGVPCNSLCR